MKNFQSNELFTNNTIDNSLYDILKVSRNANLQDIQNAFQREYIILTSSVENLMDINLEQITLLNYSYRVLSDPELRRIYDKGGILALNQQINQIYDDNGKENEGELDNFLYDLFEVDRKATFQEIQNNYFNILKHSDDQNQEKITLIHSAYSILSVSELRNVYDKEGIKGINKKFPHIDINLKDFKSNEETQCCDSILYDTLGIHQNSSVITIKESYEKALRKLEETYGLIDEDSEEVQLLHASYNILSNQETRNIYDKKGLPGVIEYQKEKEQSVANNPKAMNMDTILYESLGVNQNATTQDIQAAYEHKLKEIEEMFGFVDEESEEYQLVNAAYSVLSDPHIRQIYDKDGLAGVNQYQENLIKQKENLNHPNLQSQIDINDHVEESHIEIDNTLYDIIGVDRNVSYIDLQLAYLKKLNNMVDVDEESEEMQLVHSAYNILSNSAHRKIYDQKGLEGINKLLENELKPKESIKSKEKPRKQFEEEEDIFHITDITNDNINDHNSEAKDENENTVQIIKDVSVELDLEQLYNGCMITSSIEIDTPCPHCNGTGNEYSEHFPKCDSCHGTGEIIVEIEKPIDFLSFDAKSSLSDNPTKYQTKRICSKCMGRGEIISKVDACCLCMGLKTIKNDYQIQLRIDPGTKNNDIIRVPFQTQNQYLQVQIIEKEHTYFERIDNDLIYRKTINLTQALCPNLQFCIQTLDDRILYINGNSTKVISPHSYFRIKNEGFPFLDQNKSVSYGDLIILFEIEMPNFFSLSSKVVSFLKTVQPLPNVDVKNDQHRSFKNTTFYELPYTNWTDEI